MDEDQLWKLARRVRGAIVRQHPLADGDLTPVLAAEYDGHITRPIDCPPHALQSRASKDELAMAMAHMVSIAGAQRLAFGSSVFGVPHAKLPEEMLAQLEATSHVTSEFVHLMPLQRADDDRVELVIVTAWSDEAQVQMSATIERHQLGPLRLGEWSETYIPQPPQGVMFSPSVVMMQERHHDA